MKIRFKDFVSLFKQSGKSWWIKDPFRQSAIISYYSIFSLPALLTIVIAVAGLVFGRDAVSGQIYNQISGTIGVDTAEQVEAIVAQASRKEDSIAATIIGIVTLIIGATTVFAQFQKSLNIIWDVEADPKKSGLTAMLKTRIFSFGLIVSIGFLLLVSLVITSVISALSEWVKERFPDSILVIFQILNFIVSFAIITVLFALMFRFLPDARIRWRYVWIGSAITAFLFSIGKSLLGLYFGKAEPGSVYGAAGSIVLILLWVSYSSMIVFFGAEFTRAYSDRFGHGVIPKPNAVKADRKPTE